MLQNISLYVMVLVKGFCHPESLNSLAAVQRYSLLKLLSEPHPSNQLERPKVRDGALWVCDPSRYQAPS